MSRKKQMTFEKDSRATEWLSDLAKCFYIKSAKIKRVNYKDSWGCTCYKWRLVVEYE